MLKLVMTNLISGI